MIKIDKINSELINEIKGYSIIKRIAYITYILDNFIESDYQILKFNFKLEIEILTHINFDFLNSEKNLIKLLNKKQFYSVTESDFIDFPKEYKESYQILHDMYIKYSRQEKLKKLLN